MAQAAQSPSVPAFVTTAPFDDVSADTILASPRAWIFGYLDDASTLLQEKPAANVEDSALISNGLQDLFKFTAEKYVPAINEAIEAIPLRI
ncbi:hypothetical protein R3P38DRAFT_3210642 [Favolaschia claudopus]|uniref:Uncharacterized protein n=1 Tax=Favolaschia claudopus TaxID=2862362 RepID=A0AAW0AI59_9AGAR